MKKIINILLVCLLTVAFIPFTASAASDYQVDAPFQSYTYDSQSNPVTIPSPYETSRVITGDEISAMGFNNIEGVFYNDSRLYFCDTGNNRIVVCTGDFSPATELSEFENDGQPDTLNEPSGVYAGNGLIYVADTANSRIVVFSAEDYSFLYTLNKPKIALFNDDYTYSPVRLTADNAGRLYVIASGINQGLICLDENGNFLSFLGAPQIEPDMLEMLWRRIATKAQRAQMQSYVPTEYDAVKIDSDGFLYVTSRTSSVVPVGKINSNGKNVLPALRDGRSYGDSDYLSGSSDKGKPYFVDIALGENGICYALDSKQGKIYTYTQEGELLYIFGGIGSQKGTFQGVSGIEYMDGSLIITDRSKNNITVMRETSFGANIRTAMSLYSLGRYDEAEDVWNDVHREAAGYPLAIIGLSKIDIQRGDYNSAMARLKPINEHSLYAKAFEMYRESFLRNNFVWLLAGVAGILLLTFIAFKLMGRLKPLATLKNTDVYKSYKYGTYVMFHPFDGFWDLKHERRGNMQTAGILYFLFFALYALRLQFSGYVVTGTVSKNVNALYGVAMLALPLCFFIISNWCFTTLMNGLGTMKDIIISVAYALKPYILFSIPLFIMSHILTEQEAAFYLILDTLCNVWVLALLFFGIMITHNYSLKKTFLTVILVLVGICLIIFILLLLVNVVQEVYVFIYNTYREISFRSY